MVFEAIELFLCSKSLLKYYVCGTNRPQFLLFENEGTNNSIVDCHYQLIVRLLS
jgi:hypothetical protein